MHCLAESYPPRNPSQSRFARQLPPGGAKGEENASLDSSRREKEGAKKGYRVRWHSLASPEGEVASSGGR